MLPNGIPNVIEDTWDRFFRQVNVLSAKVTWLKSTPLGDPEVYRAVFNLELAVETYIAEAQDINDAQFDSGAEESGRDNLDLLDDESDQDIASPAVPTPAPAPTPTPAQRGLTARQRRRQQTDPDITPVEGSLSAVQVPREHSTR